MSPPEPLSANAPRQGRLLLSLAVALALTAAGCATDSRPPACCAGQAPVPASVPVSERSLFQLESSWTDDANGRVRLQELGGRPLVLTMFFAKCEYACPVLVHDMKKVEAALPPGQRSRVRFVLVSFDTERDTPPVLAEYRRNHELPPNWTLLRGGADDVLELAALLGVKFKRDARGQFAHSNVMTVLDAGGEIRHQQVGLNQAPDETARRLLELLRL